ncbi:hypothetical protein LCGC14_0254050 [marine sediment metagenome]|uniref:Cytochrome c assembly protein domain-containing protein n=1 Tax=marine sediment metagenome TaxID=412755 RepID=A0A0F9U8F9_9ZZZZ|nr:cytochrome C biogenesis protein CcmC [Phycisphaerae bacterium]HDZ44696.1 cytochrome C biogenesis protein CcmC [Phycisphaerae bacterium]
MPAKARRRFGLYWVVVAAAFAATITMLFVYTPTAFDETLGPLPIQKMFYVHLPSAINTFLACLVAFIGGIGYLWHRRLVWDDLSAAAAKVAALMCTVVLVTGMIWAKKAWGMWWVWTPRMTFSLLLWLLYVVYLVIRPSIESQQRRAMVCAVYAVAAFLDVPLVYLSVRLMPAPYHPVSVSLDPSMRWTLAAWFVPMTLLTIGLIKADFIRKRANRKDESELPPETPWTAPS